MPLEYDDIPGSWGTGSKGWPELQFETEAEALRACVACTKENVLPYGSYVYIDKGYRRAKKYTLRVETEQMKAKLEKHLAKSSKTYHDIMMEHEKDYRNQYVWLMKTYPPGHWNHEFEKKRRFPQGF